jgi:hypothetical protein
MNNLIYLISLLFLFISCDTSKKKSVKENKDENKILVSQNLQESEGYKLMEQKCFICHFPVPNPAKRDQMIAPPMLRIQEHYKPAYPSKSDFVSAIKTWVSNPSEDKVQMPGSVRKFKIMPYLAYSDEDITLIAETLYDINLGNSPSRHKGKNSTLQLNNGKKWKLDKNAINNVQDIINKLDSFNSENVKAYQNFGKEIFNTAKSLLLSEDVSDKKLEQLQAFFHNIEEDMHQLMRVKTIKEGQKQQEIIKKKFSKFFDFFE